MSTLPVTAKAEDARKFIGYDELSWKGLLEVTHSIAKNLTEENKEKYEIRQDFIKEVRERIQGSTLRELDETRLTEFCLWRLPKVQANLKGTKTRGESKKSGRAVQDAGAATPEAAVPYDPVRSCVAD